MSDPKPPVDELFGDEDIGMDGPLPPRESSSGGRTPLKLILLLVGIALLAVGWWLSSRHHDRFFIVVDGDSVRVERGYYLPFGAGGWAPTRAYEPFRLPPGIRPEKTGGMTAEQVDRVLHRLFVTVAEKELANIADGDPDVAEDMLMRAQKLRTTSINDDRLLLEKLGDVAFRRGLTEVRDIQSRFDEALKQFRLAAMRGGASFKDAQRWVDTIARQREEFRRLSVESGLDPDQVLATPGVLSRPAEKPEPPPPAPANAPDAGAP
jgi:hypothetical protein